MIEVKPACQPKLDPDFIPAALWNRAYQNLVITSGRARPAQIAIEWPNGARWVKCTNLLPASSANHGLTLRYVERLVKFLLWSRGGASVAIAGADDVVEDLKRMYAPDGQRQFDYEFMGSRCFGQDFEIRTASYGSLIESHPRSEAINHSLKGNCIGFDLGGSDRKCAAIIDGDVVYSEEVKWNPYFESDPEYHYAGIADSIERAAKHLPRVDRIGGSAAGIYIDNEPRVGSLFRGIGPADFQARIRPIFKELQRKWGDIPFAVANDGDVTAIAASMALKENAVLGISMGTSLAAGYIDPEGCLTGWINELAFVPVDYRESFARDEWSGDHGCGVQYFSQQAVGRLVRDSGLNISKEIGLPETLEFVQDRMEADDPQAAAIYETIGTYLGYALAHFSDFYDFKHLLLLGRVSSGRGGEIILRGARSVLEIEFPELAKKIDFKTADEQMKRHGQAIAAASLPGIQ